MLALSMRTALASGCPRSCETSSLLPTMIPPCGPPSSLSPENRTRSAPAAMLSPTVGASIAAGSDLVLFSGDKLLGGPQAGIIAGKSELIAQLRRHPLARAVRVDKASIAALTATLLHYLRGEALMKVPVWRMIATPLGEIERRARRWARAIGNGARVVDGRSMVGGGSLPEESLPTRFVALSGEGAQVTEVARRLRVGTTPVVGHIERDVLLLDPRTVGPDEDRDLIAAVKAALSGA